MKTKERQADNQSGILISFPGLINEKTRITYGFIVRICVDTGTDSFYFKQVIGFKDVGNIFRDCFCAYSCKSICTAQAAASCQLVLRFL